MSYGRSRGAFDGLPIPADKSYLREELSRVDESWTTARFDSLPHVVHILTSKDREGEVRILKEQSEVIEEVVDEVVHAYHSGFNKAIQNYSQILKLFSESADSISALKVDLADARELLGSRNKQLQQMWYRSLTLRHIISILDQIESVSQVPSQIEKLISGGQLYAAVQLHVRSSLMLEREGLQVVGALQDVRSELIKLRSNLFYKILEDLHSHLYNKGEYSTSGLFLTEEDSIPTTTGASSATNNSQPLSRRTRSQKIDHQLGVSTVDDRGFAFDGHDDESISEASDAGMKNSSTSYSKDSRVTSRKIPVWLSNSTPDEFIETIKKSDDPLSIKYLQTLVECLCIIGKVAAAGAIICQRLRPTIHEIITTKIKAFAADHYSSKPINGQAMSNGSPFSHFNKSLEGHRVTQRKVKNGTSFVESQMVISPVSPSMTPKGKAQVAARELLGLILHSITHILENHIIVAELLESKSSQQGDSATPKSINGDINWHPDADTSPSTGGFSLGFSLTVIQSECQQLICEILRATPEAASADAAVQTARLASKAPKKDKREGAEGLSFAFRFTEASSSANQGLNQGWKKGSNIPQEGYGTGVVLPEQGIYLAASVYRPVVQFTDKIGSLLPQKYSQLGNDGLLAFVENFLKDHFLPAMFVDYRKCIQQAISNPAAFRPRPHNTTTYSPLIETGRPVLQGLLATDLLAKEVLGWAQSMPKYASELFDYVQTFLERTYERCRTSYMEAVLERQSYMLIGRPDVENLMRTDPANACFSNSKSQYENGALDAETIELETRMSDLLLSLRPIKQDNLIRDDNRFILLASLSDSLEYVADSIERLGDSIVRLGDNGEEYATNHYRKHARTPSALPRNLAALAAEYRKLAIDCIKVLRMEMQLETIFHMQEMIKREYMEDQDAEEPDEFIIALTSQILRRDEELAPFIADTRRNYVFGGVCSIAANASIKALAEMKSINLLGVQQICRNSIAVEQALATIPLIDNEAVQQRLDRVRTYYELLNLPYEALLAFITEQPYLFTLAEYSCLLKVRVPGREIPDDAEGQVYRILSH